MKKLIILGILILFLSSCAITNKVMKSYVGRHVDELITKWGPPSQILPNQGGGYLYVYYLDRDFGRSRQYIDMFGNIKGGNPIKWKAYRMFWVDEDGYIYRWKWAGL